MFAFLDIVDGKSVKQTQNADSVRTREGCNVN